MTAKYVVAVPSSTLLPSSGYMGSMLKNAIMRLTSMVVPTIS